MGRHFLKGNGYGPARDAKYAHDRLISDAPGRARSAASFILICRRQRARYSRVARRRLSCSGRIVRWRKPVYFPSNPLSVRPPRPLALPSVDALVARERPSEPLVCLRPATIAAASRRFVEAFPGDVLYAVKCNPEPRVLRAVWAGGVGISTAPRCPRSRWCAACCPRAEVHFMHPVKSRPAIHAAFRRVRRHRFRARQQGRAGKDPAGDGAGRAGRHAAGAGPVRAPRGRAGRRLRSVGQVRRRGRGGGRAAAPGAAARGAARALLPCRLAMPRSRCLCPGDGAGGRGRRAVRRRDRRRRCRRRVSGQLSGRGAAAARRLRRGDRRGGGALRRRRQPVGRAGAGAGGGRRVGGRAGAAAPRRRALRQ